MSKNKIEAMLEMKKRFEYLRDEIIHLQNQMEEMSREQQTLYDTYADEYRSIDPADRPDDLHPTVIVHSIYVGKELERQIEW